MTEEKKKKNAVSTKRVLQFIWEAYKVFPKNGLISLGIRIITIVLGVIPALYYKAIIEFLADNLATNETASHAIGILMIILRIKLTRDILMRFMDYFLINFEMDINEHLYVTIWNYIQKHSFQFFSDHFTGSLISKIRKCVGSVERFTDNLNRWGIDFVLQVILILIIVGLQNIWIACMFLIVIVGCTFAQYKLFRWISPYQDEANALDTKLWWLLSDDITNNFNIKIFSSFSRESRTFSNLTHTTAHAWKTYFYKSMRIRWLARGVTGLLLEIGTIYIALLLRGEGTVSIGIIVLLQTYVLTVITYLGSMGNRIRHFFRCVVEIGEVVEIMDTPHSVIDHTNKKLRVTKGYIEFNNVDFFYEESSSVFEQLSLRIKPGERVGFVWPSGWGKTTVGKLLFRFYDLQWGQILIDDQDISQVTQDSLRSSIGMVPQDPVLFHRSIKENIIYGKPDATVEEMVAAAKMARCYDFIEKLPKKYDTLVGERGIKLSWGERQRVAIARAILENAPILVMDEATSALDSESEYLIQEAMEELMRNKTVIVIAHRLSTIMKMDKIMVIENGKITEKGSHKELLLKKGEYAKLWEIQSWGFIGE